MSIFNTLLRFSILLFIFIATTLPTQAQENSDALLNQAQPTLTFYQATVTDVKTETQDWELSNMGVSEKQIITAKVTKGSNKDEELQVAFYPPANLTSEYIYTPGDKIIISKSEANGTVVYGLMDRYRLPSLLVISLLFVILAIVLGGKRGAYALLGLGFSVLILAKWMVPHIAQGSNAILIGLTGAFVIAIVSMYIAHGFNKQTSIALASMLLTTIIAMVTAWAFVYGAQLFGTGSEEAYALQQFSSLNTLDLRGLLLVGIVIGCLGVLDDVTTSLTASVIELKRANMKLRFSALFKSSLRIGRTHITSLINTLVMAYAGAAMPLLLFFTLDPRPLWVILNSQLMAEEIVRSLVGSTALMLAVPITAVLAARAYERATPDELNDYNKS